MKKCKFEEFSLAKFRVAQAKLKLGKKESLVSR